MEDTILELVKICQEKEFLCMHDNVDDLIESALNTKLISINSQRLEKEQQEVKNVVEQPVERKTHIEKSLQNFRVIHKNSISLKNTSQISSVHAVAPILSIKEPEYSFSMGECDLPVSKNSPICDNHSDSKDDDDILVYEDDFEDVEFVEALLSNPEILSVEEENVVHQAEKDVNQEEEEVDLEEISQIQDIDLREKLLSINRLISNIESLNDNPIPDREINSSVLISIFEESDNFLSDNFSPEFETFCDHTEETRSGNTTTHANDSLLEYDSFFFEIEPDRERLINVLKSDISYNSSNDPLLEEADLFLASNNLIPLGIKNVAYDSEGDIRFLEELLIDDSILSYESSDSNIEDNPSVPLPPPEPPDEEFYFGDEISVVIDKLEGIDAKVKFENDNYYFFMFDKVFSLLSAESEDTIFDPGISAYIQ
nr:hypothetical protein [Tanacetum cinerariifolium]